MELFAFRWCVAVCWYLILGCTHKIIFYVDSRFPFKISLNWWCLICKQMVWRIFHYLGFCPKTALMPLTKFEKKSTIPIFLATISISEGTSKVLRFMGEDSDKLQRSKTKRMHKTSLLILRLMKLDWIDDLRIDFSSRELVIKYFAWHWKSFENFQFMDLISCYKW